MVYAISPSQSCKSETFNTLRFAQCAKAIKNKAVVNEVMQDDVNHLKQVIQQLRDELHQIKANGYSAMDSNRAHSAAWIRRSLNLLQSSLNLSKKFAGNSTAFSFPRWHELLYNTRHLRMH